MGICGDCRLCRVLAAETAAARAALTPAAEAQVGGAIIMIAGIYQLTPLKELCLSQCRTPIRFIMTSWRDGTAGAFRMGLLHGIYCLGCCWLLFVILFPLGMNVGAMAAVTLIILAEKMLPWPRLMPHAAAAALVLYGALVIASSQLHPTFKQRVYARRNADEDAREWQRTCHEGDRTSTLVQLLHLADMHSIVVVATHSNLRDDPMLCFNRAGRVVWFAPFPTRPHAGSPSRKAGASAVLGGSKFDTRHVRFWHAFGSKADMTLKIHMTAKQVLRPREPMSASRSRPPFSVQQ